MNKRNKKTQSKPNIVIPTSIDDLERILNSESDEILNILPDGTISRTGQRHEIRKPLTFKQELGGEYGRVR